MKKTNPAKNFLFAMAIVALVSPTLSYGATYAYINNSGQVNTVTADSASMALARATNISPKSGVMLIDSSIVVNNPNVDFSNFSYAGSYAYVDNSGTVRTIQADSYAMALRNAVGISAHSGVMLLSNTQADTSMVGDQVGGV